MLHRSVCFVPNWFCLSGRRGIVGAPHCNSPYCSAINQKKNIIKTAYAEQWSRNESVWSLEQIVQIMKRLFDVGFCSSPPAMAFPVNAKCRIALSCGQHKQMNARDGILELSQWLTKYVFKYHVVFSICAECVYPTIILLFIYFPTALATRQKLNSQWRENLHYIYL